MKNKKYGFSLAELLIALGIVSVISVMAVNISHKGIDKAYNGYYYTGYINMQNALIDAIDEGYKPSGDVSTNATLQFWNYIADEVFEPATCKTTGTTCNVYTNLNPNYLQITGTTNGIIYSLRYLGSFNNISNTGYNSDAYEINMTVPTSRKKSGNNVVVGNTVKFLYLPDFDSGLLAPIESNNNNAVRPSTLGTRETTSLVNLQNRKDLLPFYLDDGEVGRVKYVYDVTNDENGNPVSASRRQNPETFSARIFRTYNEAYCRKYGANNLTNGGTTYITCPASQSAVEPHSAITVENPRKVF